MSHLDLSAFQKDLLWCFWKGHCEAEVKVGSRSRTGFILVEEGS